MKTYAIKDSGARQEFAGGAVRDTEEGKLDWSNLFVWFEPMGTRFVEHMTKGRSKYPDPEPGVPNWTLFEATPETLARTLRSLDRHYKAYRAGKTDEDHAAAVLFNLNLAEKIRQALVEDTFECDDDCDCMNGGPTLNRPKKHDPTDEEVVREYQPGDRVWLKDRGVYTSNNTLIEPDYFPEVVTLRYPNPPAYPSDDERWVVESGFCILPWQVGGLAAEKKVEA